MSLSCNPIAGVEYVCPFDTAVDQEAMQRPIEPPETITDTSGARRPLTLADAYGRRRDARLLPLLPEVAPCRWQLRRLTHRQLAEALSQESAHKMAALAFRYGLKGIGGSGFLVGEPGREQPLEVKTEKGPLGEWVCDAVMDLIPPPVWLDVGLAVVTLSRLDDPFQRS